MCQNVSCTLLSQDLLSVAGTQSFFLLQGQILQLFPYRLHILSLEDNEIVCTSFLLSHTMCPVSFAPSPLCIP